MRGPPERQAFETVLRVLRADLAWERAEWPQQGVHVTLWRDVPGRRRLSGRTHQLHAAAMGRAAVISCDGTRTRWARRRFGSLAPDALFDAHATAVIVARARRDGQAVEGPDIQFVCSAESYRAAKGGPLPLEDVRGEDLRRLFVLDGSGNALTRQAEGDSGDVLAVVATENGKVVAMAGASADCEDLWQVGVDVLPEWQRRGVGRSVVSRLTGLILRAGRVPYYATGCANVPSQRIAASVGFRPAWTELFAYDPR